MMWCVCFTVMTVNGNGDNSGDVNGNDILPLTSPSNSRYIGGGVGHGNDNGNISTLLY